MPLYVLGRHEEALGALRRVRPPSYYERLYMAACEAALERRAAAGRSLERALAEKPDLRTSALDRLMPYADETVARRLRRDLRTAGLPR